MNGTRIDVAKNVLVACNKVHYTTIHPFPDIVFHPDNEGFRDGIIDISKDVYGSRFLPVTSIEEDDSRSIRTELLDLPGNKVLDI